jgi:hypothetical protein
MTRKGKGNSSLRQRVLFASADKAFKLDLRIVAEVYQERYFEAGGN